MTNIPKGEFADRLLDGIYYFCFSKVGNSKKSVKRTVALAQ